MWCHSQDNTGCGDKCDRTKGPVHRRSLRAFAKVHDTHDGDASAVGECRQWGKHTPYLRVFVAVRGTEVGGHRINDHERRTGTGDRMLEQCHVIANHVTGSALNNIRLQHLRSTDLKAFYGALDVSESTKAKFHAILHSALKAATLEGLVQRNVASLVVGKPQARTQHEDIRSQCWTAEEARAFLVAARAAGTQPAAFYTLALETGMRKGELCGLQWSDLDLDTAKVQVVRQLITPGEEPVYGPPKNGSPRTIDIGKEAVALLRTHKSHQAELKMKNRRQYHDHDLVFAKEWGELARRHDVLGDPLQLNNMGQREFAKLIAAAEVRAITMHGMRHTCATLLFQAGVPVKVIQERLGHKRVEITLGIYAHVLPSMQQDAAQRISGILSL